MWKVTGLLLCGLFSFLHGLPQGVIPNPKHSRSIYTQFIPPVNERYIAKSGPGIAPIAAAPYIAPYGSLYSAPAPQYSLKQQFPYAPAPAYPPYQYFYPPPNGPAGYPAGPGPVVYLNRYPGSADNAGQGGSAPAGGFASYFPDFSQFGNYFGGFPNNIFGGTTENSPAAPVAPPAEGAAAGGPNKGKPEKIEESDNNTEDASKSDAEKVSAAEPEQQPQYVLVGQPQFFGHFAAFPTDRDPTTLGAATKGAISSFLFYKDQPQQQQLQQQQQQQQGPIQQTNEVQSNGGGAGTASVAYQRFLYLSKQKTSDSANGKQAVAKSEPLPGSPKDVSQINVSSNSGAEPAQTKSSDGSVVQVKPNAVAFAGIGGMTGALPQVTAISGRGGLSSAAPSGTTVSGKLNESSGYTIVPMRKDKKPIAKFSLTRGYHIETR